MRKTKLFLSLLMLVAFSVGNVWATLPSSPTWEAKALADIADGSTIIIISNSNNATNIALPSTTTSSNPAKVACTVSTKSGVTTITPPTGKTLQDLAWTVKKGTSNWQFYVEGSTKNLLYLSGTSNNTSLRVGEGSSNNTFVMGDLGKLLKVTTAARYVGPNDNNGSDWRTYNTENATNYKGAALTFYVLRSVPTEPTVSLAPAKLENLESENVGDTVVTVSCKNFKNAVTLTTAFFDNAACSGDAITRPDWISNMVTNVPTTSGDTTLTFSIADNDGAAREAWLRVIATAGSVKDTAILPISQKLYVAPLTTMDAILAAAKANGSTAKEARVKFNNWVVTGKSDSYAYVSDGTKGFGINISSHSYDVGDILSGTVTVSLKLNYGSALITGVTSGTIGVTKNGTPVLNTLDEEGIAALDSVNTGSLIKIRGNCTRTGSSGSYKYWVAGVQVYGSLYNSAVTQLTLNTINEVTGVYLQYNQTKEILPRSAADIRVIPSVTVSPTSLSFEAKQNNAVAGKKFTLTGANLSDDDLTITASTGFGVDVESITPSAGAVAATQITVTPETPTTTTTPVEGTVTISGGGLEEDVVINLSMTVTPTFAVNVVVSPAGKATASINEATSAYVAAGESFDLKAAANNPSKYAFAGWTVAEADQSKITITDAESEETTASVTAAVTITANYDSITTPSLAVLPTEINFGQVDILSVQAGETFAITGAHLKTAVTLALNGEKDDDFTYEVEDGSLTPDAQENVSATIRVKPVTAVAGTYKGQLIVSSNNEIAGNATVDLDVVVNKLAAGLEWSAEEATDTLNGGLHARPTLSNPNKLTVEYSSTKTAVAEIDANGVITLKGVGETTITAASTETAICLAGNDTYTLTVQRVDTVKWIVNGVELTENRQTGLAGANITAPTPATLDGKAFVGWGAAAIPGVTNDKPALSSPKTMPDGGATLYAVFAHLDSEGSESWDLVTSASSLQKDDIITFTATCSYNYSSTSYNDTAAYAGAKDNLGAVAPIGITNNKIRIVKSGSISEVKLVEGSTSGKFKLYDIGEEKYINPANKSISYGEAGNDVTITIADGVASVGNTSYTLQYNPNMKGTQYASARFAYYSSTQKAIQIYKKNVSPAVYSAYATNQYAVSFSDPSNGTLVVKKQVGEELVAINSGDEFWSGTTLTVEAAPASADYKAGIVKVNGNTLVGTSFEIGTADVTVSATFAAKAAAGLAWQISGVDVDAASVKLSATDNVFPTLVNEHELAVTYTSGTTATATIADDGTITLVKEGSTVISAIFEGNADYKAQTVTYTLTVQSSGGTGIDNTEISEKAVKTMENGVLIIRRGGKTFNGQGQLIK